MFPLGFITLGLLPGPGLANYKPPSPEQTEAMETVRENMRLKQEAAERTCQDLGHRWKVKTSYYLVRPGGFFKPGQAGSHIYKKCERCGIEDL